MENLTERIMRHPFFRGMKQEHLGILTASAKEKSFAPAEVLLREKEPANEFYLIESGSVALEAREPGNGTMLVQNLKAGDVLGWSWLFPPFAWHFQARAIEPTSTIVLSGAHLLNTAESNHEFGYELMKRVAQVVIQRLQTTRKQLLGSAASMAQGG